MGKYWDTEFKWDIPVISKQTQDRSLKHVDFKKKNCFHRTIKVKEIQISCNDLLQTKLFNDELYQRIVNLLEKKL